MTPTDDADLVRRVRAGDAAAFDAVYDRYHARLHAFVARLAGRRDAADDLLQETWIRFATHAPGLRPDTRLGPWLFTVARNLARGYHRRRALDRVGADALARDARDDDAPATPFERAAATELERRLEAALASLAPTYREVLLLVGVEGMSPAEAAGVLGVQPDAARQRLARARAMVEAFLAKPPRAPTRTEEP